MRFYSSKDSLKRGEITWLAIIETILAMSVSIGIAIYFDTLIHIAIGSILSVFLLLQSRSSVEKGRKKYYSIFPEKKGRVKGSIVTLFLIYAVVRSLIIRITATLSHPIEGFKNIPKNWSKIVLCTDLTSPLELVPNTETARNFINRKTIFTVEGISKLLLTTTKFNVLFDTLIFIGFCMLNYFILFDEATDRVSGTIIAGIAYILSVYLIGLLSASVLRVFVFAYRFSLKSTAIVWLPMIFTIQRPLDENTPVIERLNDPNTQSLSKLVRIFSAIILILFVSKLFILPNIIGWWNSLPTSAILNVFVMPNKIHPWHIAAVTNSLITIFSYIFLFSPATHYVESGKWSESFVNKWYQILGLVRGTLSTYSIIVGIYLVSAATVNSQWPDFDWDPFPW